MQILILFFGKRHIGLLQWFGMLFASILIRQLLKLTSLSNDTVKVLRKDLTKLCLIFVSLILWEILNCINQAAAQSGPVMVIMVIIAGVLAALMILQDK